jgi:hypothetical protein
MDLVPTGGPTEQLSSVGVNTVVAHVHSPCSKQFRFFALQLIITCSEKENKSCK